MTDATGPQTANSSTSEARGSRASVFSSPSQHQQHSRPVTLWDFAAAVLPHPLRSGSVRQCGLALVPLVCVDVQRTLFVDCSVGYNVNEEFTYAGIWEQTGFRQIHMAKTGLLSQVSLFWSNAGQGSPAIMSLRTHLLGQIVFLWVGLERWSLGAIETMLQGLGTLFHCQGLFF